MQVDEPTDLEILEGPPPEPTFDYVSPYWLVATAQDHHLRRMMIMTFCGSVLAALGWLLQLPALHLSPLLPEAVLGTGALLVCGGLLYTLRQIRCRECGARVALHFIRHERFREWIRSLQTATSCPQCGHHPAPPGKT